MTKYKQKKIAKEYGLPVIEGSDGGVKDKEHAKEICVEDGQPVEFDQKIIILE